jgi:glycosyltransferase involved in cell wall biosynthesis
MSRISICIPTYNGEPYIELALRSVLQQTFEDYELIVIDDQSTDGTYEHVAAITDHRLRLEKNSTRLGLVGNWNRCIQLASGEYLSIFHQDDIMEPNNIQKKVELLNNHPAVGYVFSEINNINSLGEVVGRYEKIFFQKNDSIFNGFDFFRYLLMEGNFVSCPSVLVRTNLYREWGGFDPRLMYTPDFEMWLRLALHTSVAYLSEPLVSWRRHSSQESNQYLGMVHEIKEVYRAVQIVFSEQRAYIPEPDKLYMLAINHLRGWTYIFLRQSIRKGNIKQSVRFLRTLFEINGNNHSSFHNLDLF